MAATYRVTVQGTLLGEEINSVFGVRDSSPGFPDPESAADIAARVRDAFVDNYLPWMCAAYSMTGVDAVDYESGINGAFVPVADAGALEEPVLPSYVTAKIRWSTGLRGRAYRGRTGLPAMPESQSIGNTLDPGYVSVLTTASNGFMNDVRSLAEEIEFVVVSTVVNGAPRPAPLWTPIISGSCASLLGSQLSRKPTS